MTVVNKIELERELKNFKELREKTAADGKDTTWIDSTIADLEKQLGRDPEQQKDEKHRELQDLVVGYNFNELFGNPEANKIIHKLLYDEAAKHLAEIEAKDAEITRLTVAVAQKDTDLIASKADVTKLQQDKKEMETQLEDAIKDARYQLNEATRLTLKVQTLTQQLEAEKKAKRELSAPSDDLQKMIDDAKAAKQQKRQLTNVRKLDECGSRYAGEDENGNTVEFNWLEKNTVEEVKAFQPLRLPELKDPNPPQIEVTPKQLEDAFPGVPQKEAVARTGDTGGEGVQKVAATVEDSGNAQARAPMNPEIAERFKRIEEHLGLKEWKYE